MTSRPLLETVERYYDRVPRATARIESIGPFTLFVLDRRSAPPDGPVPGVEVRVLEADDPVLGEVVGTVGAAFSGHGEVVAADPGSWPDVIGRGSHSPRGGVSELTGIGVLPSYRQRGVGALITARLAADADSAGTQTVFLSARDDDAARVYQRQGFVRVATACLAEPR